MKVLILLSTYNGAKYIRDQIDSLLNQTITLNILVRDDGSTDSTCEILEEYKRQSKLNWYTGENLKPAKSFWDLVKKASNADYYCFCDQDDVWFKDKVERAIKKLEEVENQNQPLLYCSNVTVTDAILNPQGEMYQAKAYTDFAHSLIYSLAPGCTFVFNDLARKKLLEYDMDKDYEIIHDWLTHKIVAMFGKVIYDKEPTMYYRQHGNNVIGAKRSKIARLKRLLKSNERIRSNCAASLLEVYNSQLSEDNFELLNIVANYSHNKKLKKQFKKDKRFSTSTVNSFVLHIMINLNKV